MQVYAFQHVVFQAGAWKQGWAEAGRVTYKATQEHASLDVVCSDQDRGLRFRAAKGTKVAISGNSIHLPDSLR